jgi:uncharacterized protein (DUF1810 family)
MADLTRFRDAQKDLYETALAELEAGEKRGHWMWFIFPQLSGLGRSPAAFFYGIADPGEARDYMADPLLGVRYRECCRTVAAHGGQPPENIVGPVDALKLRSSATLMARAATVPEARTVLEVFYGGTECPLTLNLLGE